MKKWQELALNALMNVGVALIAGGILKLAIEGQSVVSSVVVTMAGIYFLSAVVFASKKIEED